MDLDPAWTQRSVRAASGCDGRRDLGLGHPEFGRTGPHGERDEGLRRDVRIEPVQHVDGPSPGPADGRREALGLFGRLHGDPAQRVAPSRRPRGGRQIGRGLADPLQRDPMVRDAGTPGQRPLAARHDVRPEPSGADLGDDRRHVVGLDRVLADDRIRKGVPNRRAGRVERREVRDEDRCAEPAGGAAEGRRERSLRPVSLSQGRPSGYRTR